ncbi:MAG: type II toxin-antitoxin system ParD family antitoxin [Stellaceae bacterium]
MNISISLTPELLSLIKAKVASGRYTSISEVVREALRLLERLDRLEEERIEELRHAWREGIESGDAGLLDFGELRQAALQELRSRAKN